MPIAETETELHTGGAVVLDASGNGQIPFVTDHANQRWEVEHISVSTSQAITATPIPGVATYVNVPGDAQHSRGASFSGILNDFDTPNPIKVGMGDVLYVSFTGGIAGTTAYATLEGSKFSRRWHRGDS